jgi:hypothetical protein
MGEVVLWHIQSGKLAPCPRVFQVAPDSCNRIQLWAIGWEEDEAHVGREGESLGCMGPAVVQEQAMEAIWDGLSEGLQEELKALRVEIWSLQEDPVAGCRLHRAIDREPREAMRHRAHRLHATRGEASATDGQ